MAAPSSNSRGGSVTRGLSHWAVGSALFAACGGAGAVDITVLPQFHVLSRLDDNVRLSAQKAEGALGFDTAASVAVAGTTETATASVTPRTTIRRFAFGDNLDADEYGVSFGGGWQQEIFKAQLDGGYSHDSTLTSEATDTGVVDDVKYRNSINLQPSVVVQASERWSIRGIFLFNDTSFEDAANSGLIDYEYKSGTLNLNWLASERLTLFSNVIVGQFDAPDIKNNTRTYEAQVGGTWNFDPTFQMTGSIGWNHGEIDEVVRLPQSVLVDTHVSSTTDAPVASASVLKTWQTWTTRLDYQRLVSPSSRGAQSISDRIIGNISHRLTDRLIVTADGIYEMREAQQSTGSIQSAAADLNRDYREIRCAVRYRFAEEWWIGASYRFGHRESSNPDSNEVAETNAVYMTLDFVGNPKRF